MWRPATLILAVGLASLWPAAAWAQRRLPSQHSTLLSEQYLRNFIPMTISSGRIVKTKPCRFPMWSQTWSSGEVKEQLAFQGNGIGGTMHYQRTSPQEQLLVEISSEGRVVLRHNDLGKSPQPPVEFAQLPDEPLSLTLGSSGNQTVYRAPTLWHLLIEEPDVSRRQLLPLLDVLPCCGQARADSRQRGG